MNYGCQYINKYSVGTKTVILSIIATASQAPICVSQGVMPIIHTTINPYNLCVGDNYFPYSQISILRLRVVNFLATGHRDN